MDKMEETDSQLKDLVKLWTDCGRDPILFSIKVNAIEIEASKEKEAK